MGFESARLPDTAANEFGWLVPASDALRVWKGFVGGVEVTEVLHNNFTLGTPAIAVLGPGWGWAQGVIEGRYTVTLLANELSEPYDVAISQMGNVPPDAHSLLFKARAGRGSFSLSLGGSVVPFVPLTFESNYVEYGADVSAFAGTMTELRFTAHAAPGMNIVYLDSFVFLPTNVPEPRAVALWGAGMIWLFCARKKRL